MIFRPARGFVCLRCGEFVEVDDDSAAACDCVRAAEIEAKRREELKRLLIWRYRSNLLWIRYRRKRLKAVQEAM
jgi:hypothetical protein